MRGALQPSKKHQRTETQIGYEALSRGRRAKLAAAAGTTLVKAHQWARGEDVGDLSKALEAQVAAHLKKKKG